jgi:hypothetical protein
MSNAKAVAHKPPRTARSPHRPKDWDEVAALKAKHLKPVAHGPKGQPIYAYHDVAKLDVAYPDEKE